MQVETQYAQYIIKKQIIASYKHSSLQFQENSQFTRKLDFVKQFLHSLNADYIKWTSYSQDPNVNAKVLKYFQFQIQHMFQSDLQEFIAWYMHGVKCILHQQEDSQENDWNLDLIVQLYNLLSQLGLSRLFESELSEILYSEIEVVVESIDSLDANVEWLHECIFPLLRLFYSSDSCHWKKRVEYHLYKSFTLSRIEKIFDIIADYPDSLPMIHDLKTSLKHVNASQELISTLLSMVQDRLLQPVAATEDILSQYINIYYFAQEMECEEIKSVFAPINNYISNRPNGVKCILNIVLEQELWNDMDSIQKKQLCDQILSIYSNTQVYIQEFEKMLMDRLLSNPDYLYESELKDLEVLKTIFGESSLNTSSVMLKDIVESKRMDSRLNQTKFPFNFKGIILSHLFWPSKFQEYNALSSSQPELETCFKEYTCTYESIKGGRHLEWDLSMGNVQVDLVFANKTLSITALPIQVLIIMEFEDEIPQSLTSLESKIGLSSHQIHEICMFWKRKGVLIEIEPNLFALDHDSHASMDHTRMESMELSSVLHKNDCAQLDLSPLLPFVIGMLTNLGLMDLESIHKMLSMMASGTVKEPFSLGDLREFLTKSSQFEEEGGKFRIVK